MTKAPTARDLMSPNYLTICEHQTLREAFAVLLDDEATANGEHTFVVAHEDGGFAGMLSLRGFLGGLFANWNLDVRSSDAELEPALRDRLDEKIAGITEGNRPRVSPDMPLTDLIEAMVEPEFECLPVIEGDEVLGVIYIADVFRTAASLALTPQTSGIRVEERE